MAKKDSIYWTGDVVKILEPEDEIHVWVRIIKMKGKKFEGLYLMCENVFVTEFRKEQILDSFDENIYGCFYKYMFAEDGVRRKMLHGVYSGYNSGVEVRERVGDRGQD